MSDVRIAIIGLGFMGLNHLRVFNSLKNVKVNWVVDLDPERLKQAGNVNVSNDINDVCGVDAVSICVPTSYHFSTASYFIKKGVKNIFLEKPMTSTIGEAVELVSLADRYKVNLMIGHIERFNPAVVKLKELGLNLSSFFSKRVSPFPSRIKDCGVILDTALHDVDVVRFLCSENFEMVDCTASGDVNKFFEDEAVITLSSANCSARVFASWNSSVKERILKAGDCNDVLLDFINQELFVDGKKIHVVKRESLLIELEHFINAVNGAKCSSSYKDAFESMKLVFSAIECYKKGGVLSS